MDIEAIIRLAHFISRHNRGRAIHDRAVFCLLRGIINPNMAVNLRFAIALAQNRAIILDELDVNYNGQILHLTLNGLYVGVDPVAFQIPDLDPAVMVNLQFVNGQLAVEVFEVVFENVDAVHAN